LIKSGHLTAHMKPWASRLKLGSDIEDATAGEAEEFAAFVQVLLEQIFTVRSRIKAF